MTTANQNAPTATGYSLAPAWTYEVRAILGTILKYLVLVVIMLIALFPIYWMVITAFKSRLELTTYPPTLFPANPIWDNFHDAFTTGDIPRYILNSVAVVSISTFISMLFGTLASAPGNDARMPSRTRALTSRSDGVDQGIFYPKSYGAESVPASSSQRT